MNWILTPDAVTPQMRDLIGGKALRLARLQHSGYAVPRWLCVTTNAYNAFLDSAGLRERIALELHRKVFEEMRWEEIWDCALRIRHLFHSSDLTDELHTSLAEAIHTHFGDTAVAVRSSATDEDTRQASFAGLHASYVNLRGVDAVLKHIVRVWASLWSDAALLYRKEIGLDISQSTMAVLVQKLVHGKCSGVTFTRHPTEPDHMVLEAVHGLNQGLVEGAIEPDRWIVDRSNGRIMSHRSAKRHAMMAVVENGVEKIALPQELQHTAPLTATLVHKVAELAMEVEQVLGRPQDVEWTIEGDRIVLLQARDITTLSSGEDDQRGWYLSLHRSYDQLVQLRQRIENDYIPEMITTAEELSRMDLAALSNAHLIKELQRRWDLNRHWSAIYWSDFIPYAHGVRLFGQFYNDAVAPDDPYEFMDLLTSTDMQSVQRNNMLQELAGMLRDSPGLAQHISSTLDQNPFEERLERFLAQYGDLTTSVTGRRSQNNDLRPLLQFLTSMGATSSGPITKGSVELSQDRQKAFLQQFSGQARDRAEALLNLARSSYQLRDDDNIHLGRIEAQFLSTVDEARRRLPQIADPEQREALKELLQKIAPELEKKEQAVDAQAQGRFNFRQRQLVGQPAGPGLAKGIARFITSDDQLTTFKPGEILVCDAVDPNMTFVVPLASGIVERRGGMLIHGAIIAREYGLPCITGVPRAIDLIRNGDTITVDGYLGIVTLD